ncbi:MAG TPA: serine/threonine-protein kinase, partial [Myxococcaceae bacterium]
MVDSPVDVPSSSGFKPKPDTGAEITQTFNGENETPWGRLTTSDLQTPSIGSVLDFGELGAFKLEARLGRGGMGEVYRARQVGPKGFSQVVAIKRLRPGRHEWEERSFVDEARVLSMLHHENIARVYGFYELAGNAYLVMEYIEGETLYSLLETARHRGTRFSERAACLIAADVAEALHYSHLATDDAGRLLQIVHRDVSTTNIIISNTGRTKLVDFG